MRKILLLAAAAILLTATTQAKVITPGENQVWWGYFSESDFATSDNTIGTGSPMALMGAIYVPANHEQLGRATVMGARIYISSSAVSSLSSLKIWVSKTLPNKVTDADIVQTTLGTLTAGANDFKFRTPFEVDNQGFYVGYYVNSTTGYFIRMGGSDAPNDAWVGNPDAGMGWTDLNGNGLGKLAFQILVQGGSFPEDCVTADDFGQKVVLQGEQTSIPITVTNQGSTPVKSISYTITTEGGSTTDETSVSLASLPLNGTATINVPFASDNETKKFRKTFTITQVNGKPNTATHNSATGFLITLKDKQPVTPVIEEFTGTWCGWCPRGTVGMEKVHDAYGDQVVQIAAHNSDPMAISEYQNVINAYTSGFPNSITDRQFVADPSFSGLKTALDASFNRVAPATIGLTAEWESATKTKVVFKTTTRFAYDDDNANFGIAFLLLEDGMKGTGSNWAQANYYSGMSVQQAGTDMQWWCKQGSSVTGVEFNHVVVAAWSALNGVNNSVEPVIEAGADQEYTYTASIASKSLIQDKTKLKAAVLLIDRTSGTIVNAAQCAISDEATGIQSVRNGEGSMADVPAGRYTIDGRKLSTVQKGINIVRMNDGTVRKVLVK